MKLIAYLNFEGCANEAINFYKEIFDAQITYMMKYGDAPDLPDFLKGAEHSDKILHSCLKFDGNELFISDSVDGSYKRGNNISLTLNFDDISDQKIIFDQLAKNGEIIMPLDNMFWGSKFGSVIDQYGIYWSLDCELQ
jgi:PhnB protein